MGTINKLISIVLLAWMGIFTQISTSHMGHGHDLLPAEANLCAIDCEEDSHHSAGEACQWFLTKRHTSHDGIQADTHPSPMEYDAEYWTAQSFLFTASHPTVYWDRGPPII